MMAVFDVNDTLSNQTKNGDAFSNPMDPRYRAKPYVGPTNLAQIRDVLLPSISAMDVYPKEVVEEASRFLGGGMTNFEAVRLAESNTLLSEEQSGDGGSGALGTASEFVEGILLSIRRFIRR